MTTTSPTMIPTGPRTLLRLEAALVFLAALAAYAALDGAWGVFLALFLVPDLSMLGYLAGPRPGAIAYNAAHTYLAGGALAALGLAVAPSLLPIALIWIAHVGFDRMLGYGLKAATGFGHTHLGTLAMRGPRFAVYRSA